MKSSLTIGNTKYSVTSPKFLNQARREAKELTKQSGASGTEIFSGFITNEDANAKFQDPDLSATEIRKMLLDPVVGGLLNAFMLPILRAEATIEPASNDNIDLQIAEEVEDNLFNNEHFTYQQWLRDRLLYLPFGFEAASKRFESPAQSRDGNWRWMRWTHLKPETVCKWFLDDDGNLEVVEQLAFDPATQKFGTFKIPVEQVFHVAHNMEGHNFQGTSAIRSGYRSWFLKDKKMRLMGIQAERGGLGIPHIEVEGTDNLAKATEFAQSLRSHEKSYAVSSKGEWAQNFIGGKDFFGIDLIPMVNLHNREMVEGLSFGFLQQAKGDSSSGSFAKQTADIEFGMMGVEGSANHLEDIINNGNFGTQNIKQLVQLRHGEGVTQFPKYKIGKISSDDVQALMTAIKTAKDAGVFRVSEGDEEWVRDKLGAPEFVEELTQEVNELAPPVEEEEEIDEN